jgi:uncharacterized protein YecE (DUF72 family)
MTEPHPPSAHIGTSGWSYREWRGRFYPQAMPATGYLAHYAQHFTDVELNSTAYGLPKPEFLARWSATVPVNFRMAIKAPHLITHFRRLRQCAAEVDTFLSAIRPLGAHRSVILFQMPPSLVADAGLLAAFLGLVRPLVEGLPLVCEFRHPSWYEDAVFAVLEQAGVACCVHDMPGSELREPRTSGLLYIRRHGTTGKYVGAYGRERLTDDARLIRERLAAGQNAYAFFNNTAGGAAVDDAFLLQGLVKDATAAG